MVNKSMELDLAGLEIWAGEFSKKIKAGDVFYLKGDLGAGKTSFVRALLNSLGFSGPVKSPTYSLIESYDLDNLKIHHLDLYRLKDPSELEQLGLEDLLSEPCIFFIEWPECGEGYLPQATQTIEFLHDPVNPLLRILKTRIL